MLRSRSTASRPRTSLRPPTSKELDLLILAGCSCLITILYHPVASTMQSASTASSGTAVAIATEVSRSTQSSPVHTTLPPKRETLRKEDEEDA